MEGETQALVAGDGFFPTAKDRGGQDHHRQRSCSDRAAVVISSGDFDIDVAGISKVCRPPNARTREPQVAHCVRSEGAAGAPVGGATIETDGTLARSTTGCEGESVKDVVDICEAVLDSLGGDDDVGHTPKKPRVSCHAAHGEGVVVVHLSLDSTTTPRAVFGGRHQGKGRVVTGGGEGNKAEARARCQCMFGQEHIEGLAETILKQGAQSDKAEIAVDGSFAG